MPTRQSHWNRAGKTRRERGYGPDWDRKRVAILKRDDYLCQPCMRRGHVTLATEVDHVIPKHRGGTDDERNLQAICSACHAAKTAVEAAEAQGRTPRWPQAVGDDGWPIDLPHVGGGSKV